MDKIAGAIFGGVQEAVGGFAADAIGALIPGASAFEDVLKKFVGNGGLAAVLTGSSFLPAPLASALEEVAGMPTQRHEVGA